MSKQITPITRKKIFRLFSEGINWHGDLGEVEFLERLFLLEDYPSEESKNKSLKDDIIRHRISFPDWDEMWILTDNRINLISCEDEIFLKFLVQVLHPEVRIDQSEVSILANSINNSLKYDGYEIYVEDSISGHPIYDYRSNEHNEDQVMINSGIQRNYDDDIIKSIWGVKDAKYKLFISHKHSIQKDCASLKEYLAKFHISSFVAHVDAEVNAEWQERIEIALQTCDGLLAILTNDFYESDWTEQEIGCAIGRNIDIFSLGLGEKARGFIGKYQTILNVNSLSDHSEILTNLSNVDGVFNSLLYTIENCGDQWEVYNEIYDVISRRKTLKKKEADGLIELANRYNNIYNSNKFGGRQGYKKHEKIGLVELLHEKTGVDYSSSLII